MSVISNIKKTAFEVMRWATANQYIGNYPDIKAKKNRVNQFEYHPDQSKSTYNSSFYNKIGVNLGDSLSFVVVDWMLAKRGLTSSQEVKKKYFLNTIGSNALSSYQDAVIWGSGCLTSKRNLFFANRILHRHPFQRLDVRAVRGPNTRETLIRFGHKCPEVYGDPAILMPLIYTPTPVLPTKDVLVIPQFVAETNLRAQYPDIWMESMNTDNYKQVIDAIVSAKKVVTSSLHGIILAESYGVPVVFFRSLKESRDFKYLDYYYSTGRYNIKIATSVEEAMAQDPLPLPDLSELQNGLMDTFPYDLWNA